MINEDKLRQAFEFFDKDGSGSISLDELKQVLGVKKRLVDDGVWNQLISEVDIDGNGEIDYKEFKIMMNKLVREQAVSNRVSITQSTDLKSSNRVV